MRGRAWLVAWLLVVMLSAGVLAGPLSGQWSVWGRFEYDADERILLIGFESLLEIDYTTCGWTFTGSALFSKHQFEYLWFIAGGSVAAIDFYSALTFGDPVLRPTMQFLSWISATRMSIAGVDLYGIFAVQPFWYQTEIVRSGLVLGGSGSPGDCDICVEVSFNLWLELQQYQNGYPYTVDVCHRSWDCLLSTFTPAIRCAWPEGWDYPPRYTWFIEDPTCCPCFTYATIYLQQPFACFDLAADVLFTGQRGFEGLTFTLCDICLGLPWLELGMLQVHFGVPSGLFLDGTIYRKQVQAEFDLIVADCVCFTPYLVLDTDDFFELDSIGLAALTVEYDMGQGVTFKAGHGFFDHPHWHDVEDCEVVEFTAFTETGDVVMWTGDIYCDPYPCLMRWD